MRGEEGRRVLAWSSDWPRGGIHTLPRRQRGGGTTKIGRLPTNGIRTPHKIHTLPTQHTNNRPPTLPYKDSHFVKNFVVGFLHFKAHLQCSASLARFSLASHRALCNSHHSITAQVAPACAVETKSPHSTLNLQQHPLLNAPKPKADAMRG